MFILLFSTSKCSIYNFRFPPIPSSILLLHIHLISQRLLAHFSFRYVSPYVYRCSHLYYPHLSSFRYFIRCLYIVSAKPLLFLFFYIFIDFFRCIFNVCDHVFPDVFYVFYGQLIYSAMLALLPTFSYRSTLLNILYVLCLPSFFAVLTFFVLCIPFGNSCNFILLKLLIYFLYHVHR